MQGQQAQRTAETDVGKEGDPTRSRFLARQIDEQAGHHRQQDRTFRGDGSCIELQRGDGVHRWSSRSRNGVGGSQKREHSCFGTRPLGWTVAALASTFGVSRRG